MFTLVLCHNFHNFSSRSFWAIFMIKIFFSNILRWKTLSFHIKTFYVIIYFDTWAANPLKSIFCVLQRRNAPLKDFPYDFDVFFLRWWKFAIHVKSHKRLHRDFNNLKAMFRGKHTKWKPSRSRIGSVNVDGFNLRS